MYTGFTRITDKATIREILDGYIHKPEAQKVSFIPVIFSREHRPGGIAYEGHRPMAACQTEDDRNYTLTTGDSGYSLSVGSVKLSGIEYLDVFPEMVPQPKKDERKPTRKAKAKR